MRNFRLTYNQIELLRIIYSFKYLPLRGLLEITKANGLFGYKESLHKVIKKLERLGLVNSFFYGNNWKVVYITSLGADVLADSLGIPRKDILVPNRNVQLKFANLEHTLSIVNIYTALISNFEFKNWLGDQQVFCKYEFRANISGKKIIRNLIPDGYFEVENQKFFLELDTGTMDRDQLAMKFRRYFEYYVYGDWKDKYGKYPNVLFITERPFEQMARLIQNEDLDRFLMNRNYFINSKNVLYKGIGISDNLRSINSRLIAEFLQISVIFTYKEYWIKDLQKFLDQKKLISIEIGLFDKLD